MKALELLKQAEHQYFNTIKTELKQYLGSFDEYFESWQSRLEELNVSYECISGIEGLNNNITLEITNALEQEVSTTNHWVFIFTGHTGEFDLFNKTKDEAAELISELKGNPYVTSIFIMDKMNVEVIFDRF